jgi:hypothetical protein
MAGGHEPPGLIGTKIENGKIDVKIPTDLCESVKVP